jgi:hypothetical protein
MRVVLVWFGSSLVGVPFGFRLCGGVFFRFGDVWHLACLGSGGVRSLA